MMSNKVKEKEEIKEEVEEIEDESTNNEENSECNIDNEKDKSSDDLTKECKCSDDSDKECKCENKKKDKKGLFKKNKEIEELQQQVASFKEMLLRNQAELQNYKRRREEETAKMMKYKDEDLIKEFLVVLDNFERAIKMDDDDLTDEVSRFLEGFKLIYSNTINILNKFEVKEIEAEGVEFDPDYHHAVLTEHDENKPAGVVLEVLQKGYMYKDKVIRPAMVKVNE